MASRSNNRTSGGERSDLPSSLVVDESGGFIPWTKGNRGSLLGHGPIDPEKDRRNPNRKYCCFKKKVDKKRVDSPYVKCDFVCKTNVDLARHELTHCQNPWACPYEDCDKDFHQKSQLETHVRSGTHEGLKPFQCQTCEKKFSDQSSALRHEKESGDSLKKEYLEMGLEVEPPAEKMHLYKNIITGKERIRRRAGPSTSQETNWQARSRKAKKSSRRSAPVEPSTEPQEQDLPEFNALLIDQDVLPATLPVNGQSVLRFSEQPSSTGGLELNQAYQPLLSSQPFDNSQQLGCDFESGATGSDRRGWDLVIMCSEPSVDIAQANSNPASSISRFSEADVNLENADIGAFGEFEQFQNFNGQQPTNQELQGAYIDMADAAPSWTYSAQPETLVQGENVYPDPSTMSTYAGLNWAPEPGQVQQNNINSSMFDRPSSWSNHTDPTLTQDLDNMMANTWLLDSSAASEMGLLNTFQEGFYDNCSVQGRQSAGNDNMIVNSQSALENFADTVC